MENPPTSKNVKFTINCVRSQEAIFLWKGSKSLAVIPGHVEVNNEWVSAIVKDKFSDRNFLDASGEPNLIDHDLVWQDWGMASFVPVRKGQGNRKMGVSQNKSLFCNLFSCQNWWSL